MDTVYIAYVDPAPRPSGIYRITATDGTEYATKDAWVASLCQRAKDRDQPVKVWSGSGWFYREMREVRLVEPTEQSA